jgi:hypothetical protein
MSQIISVRDLDIRIDPVEQRVAPADTLGKQNTVLRVHIGHNLAQWLKMSEVIGDEHASAHAPWSLLVGDFERRIRRIERCLGVRDVEATCKLRDSRVFNT